MHEDKFSDLPNIVKRFLAHVCGQSTQHIARCANKSSTCAAIDKATGNSLGYAANCKYDAIVSYLTSSASRTAAKPTAIISRDSGCDCCASCCETSAYKRWKHGGYILTRSSCTSASPTSLSSPTKVSSPGTASFECAPTCRYLLFALRRHE